MKQPECKLCFSNDISIIVKGDVEVTVCKSCGFQFIDNHKKYLTEDHFDNYYKRRKEDNVSEKNSLREKQYQIDVSFLSKYLKKNQNILDVGCSNGKFISIVNTVKDGLNCEGIDIDESGISDAIIKYGESVVFKKQTLASLNYKDKYDIVIFRGTFQYLADELHQSISTLREILKNNGKVVIFSLPSTDSFMYFLLGEKWGLFHPEMSLMFNENSFTYLAERYNFCIDSLEYPYLGDIYADQKKDYENIKDIIKGKTDNSNPFWGSLMTIVMSKNN